LTGLAAGTYTVEVTSGSESVSISYTLDPFGVLSVDITNSCSGNPGNAQITTFSAQSPVLIHWYTSSGTQIGSFSSIYNLQAGEYSYSLTDADGCVDSASVVIQASTPVLEMFAADSALCYGEATEVWFTPGFILYDGLFPVYDTSTDTLTWINQMSGNYLPNTGIDQYGCWATISNDPIVYSQPEPWPMLTIYNYGDTISLDWGIDENPDPNYTYNWYLDGVLVESYAYSYLAVQVSGTYSVHKVNQYGCYNTGVISITVTGIIEKSESHIQVLENPVAQGHDWSVNYSGEDTRSTMLYNSVGQQLQKVLLSYGTNCFGSGLSSGMYFLQVDGRSFKLLKE
ncbi:MAG: hypothetical protein ACKO1R_01835, partial [Crocinitomicaceae bacterium]